MSLCTLSPFILFYLVFRPFCASLRQCRNFSLSATAMTRARKEQTKDYRPMFASTQSAVQKKKKERGRTGDHSRKSTRRNIQPPRLSAHSPRLDLNLIRSCIEFKDFSKENTFSASPPPPMRNGETIYFISEPA